MFYEQICICGIIIIVAIKIFSLLSRRVYKSPARKVIVVEESGEEIEHNPDDIRVYKEDLKIVGIAKPVGKWTKKSILERELMWRLAYLINEEGSEKGYWELFIKAQASIQGKYKGRGR